ncbi:MAG: hypothetical protein NVS3B19_01740 [Ginsengibacter sp.]
MKKYKLYSKLICTLCTGLFFFNVSTAQNKSDSSISKDAVTASVNYQSLLHYFGRTDSLKSSGLFPMVGLKSKTGLYTNASFIFIQNPATPLQYTGTILEGGYRLPDNKTITGNFYFQQFLYKSNSTLKQAAIKSQAGFNTTYNNKIANLNLGADVKFSPGNTDFGITGGIDKMILFRDVFDKTTLAIDPAVNVYAGTQNFTAITKSSNFLGFPSYSTQQYKSLSILAYEVTLPVVLVRGKFNAYLSPSFVSPQHLINAPNSSGGVEKGSNIFYIAAGIGVRL